MTWQEPGAFSVLVQHCSHYTDSISSTDSMVNLIAMKAEDQNNLWNNHIQIAKLKGIQKN